MWGFSSRRFIRNMTRRVLSATIEDERACGFALAADGGGSSNRDQQDDAPRPEAPDSPGSLFDDPFQLGLGRSGGSGDGSGRPGGGPGRRGPSRVSWLYILLVCGLLAYVIFSMNGGFGAQSPTDELATSEFVTAVEEGRVANVTYTVRWQPAVSTDASRHWQNAALKHLPLPTWAPMRLPTSWPAARAPSTSSTPTIPTRSWTSSSAWSQR